MWLRAKNTKTAEHESRVFAWSCCRCGASPASPTSSVRLPCRHRCSVFRVGRVNVLEFSSSSADTSRRCSLSHRSSSAPSGSPKLPTRSPTNLLGRSFPFSATLTSMTPPSKTSSNVVGYRPTNGRGGPPLCTLPLLNVLSTSSIAITPSMPRTILHRGSSSLSRRTKSDPPMTLSPPCMTSHSLSPPSHLLVHL